MRALLGRAAGYSLPFAITTIGFALLTRWYQSLPPWTLYDIDEYSVWVAATLLIGLPGMGTLCAVVGTQTGLVNWAWMTGLAGFIVSSVIAAFLGVGPVIDALTVATLASVPFLVGFRVGWLATRPSVGAGTAARDGPEPGPPAG
jgi:hypothetical protein